MGITRAAEDLGFEPSDLLAKITTVVHGTTLGTNAVLTGRGAKTGFITTKGFRDVLNLRRGLKEEQWVRYSPPAPLVPRRRIYGLSERVGRSGQELLPLNENEVREAVREMKGDGVRSIAVSFLWSFLNPTHEQRSREIIEEIMPEAYVSISSEVLPQIRLYERNSTTVLNAYVGPLLDEYLENLHTRLSDLGFSGSLLIMQSNGGIMSLETARRFAANTLLSGPAAGPVAGALYGEAAGDFSDVITIDMGGTSFDVALIKGKKATVTTEGKIGDYGLAIPVMTGEEKNRQ
jgi:N-methylhydantoinase A